MNGWWLLGLAAFGLPACRSAASAAAPSSPGPYVSEFALPGKRVTVEYWQPGGAAPLALVNRGSTDPEKVYSHPRGNLSLKVATDANMADLCENLRRLGFHEMAESSPPSSALWSLRMEVDGRSSAVYRVRNRTENLARLGDLLNVFLVFYNNTLALHSVDNPNGPGLFEQEKQRMDTELLRKKGVVR
jgi:hypothetical protein